MKAVLQFGHHGTLIRLSSLIGLFAESPWLTSSNMDDNARRSFRQSRVGSFSANLAVVLYDCGGGDGNESSHNHRRPHYCLELRYNERPVAWPRSICSASATATRCPYEVVRSHFSKTLRTCDLDAICSQGNDELWTLRPPLPPRWMDYYVRSQWFQFISISLRWALNLTMNSNIRLVKYSHLLLLHPILVGRILSITLNTSYHYYKILICDHMIVIHNIIDAQKDNKIIYYSWFLKLCKFVHFLPEFHKLETKF